MPTSKHLIRLALVAILVTPASLGVAAGPAAAATFTVDSTADAVDADLGDGTCATAAGACTLRAAIQQANQLGGSHTIVLPAGTYTLDIVGPGEDAAATGDLDVTADITVEGAGASATIVAAGFGSEAGQVDRLFDVQTGGSLAIDGITVRDGEVRGTDGGGIRSVGTLVVLNSTVTNNRALEGGGSNGNGGGIIGEVGSVTVRNSLIEGNEAQDDGGGITAADNAVLVIADSVIRGNVAGDKGGGIEVNNDPATATITGSWIVGNSSNDGGGVSFRSETQGTISTTTISGNNADADGGAIEANSRVVLTVVNSTLSGNSGGIGGAIENEGNAQLSLTNVTIVDNATTVATNAAISNEGTVTMVNTIVADNPGAPDCRTDTGATFVSNGSNLDSDGTCGLTASGDQPSTAPELGALADNGGFAPTHLPQVGSPVIDAGDDVACPATDQRGVTRPQDGDDDGAARCDIGAVEVSGVVTETEEEVEEVEEEDDVVQDVVDPDEPVIVESVPAIPVTAEPTFTG